MFVTCPNCSSRYVVDPLAIGPDGRKVQCVRCNHRWYHKAEETSPLPEVAIRPTEAGVSTALPAVIVPKPMLTIRQLLVIGAVIVVLVAAMLFTFRQDISQVASHEARASTPTQATVASAPKPQRVTTADPTATAPASVQGALSSESVSRTSSTNTGASASNPISRPSRPAQVEATRASIEVDLGSSKIDVVDGRYVIRGQLVNNGKVAGSTMQLRLTFKKNNRVLGERSYAMVEGPLPPGGRTNFSQTLDDPPAGTTDIVPVVE